MKTVADVLVETLQAAGIDTVFGLPGGENVAVMDALRRYGLRFVLARHESSAVFMADATARLTGKPGVCLTTLGPGVQWWPGLRMPIWTVPRPHYYRANTRCIAA